MELNVKGSTPFSNLMGYSQGVMISVFDTEGRGSSPFIPFMKMLHSKIKKNNLNSPLKKKSHYSVFYEFQTSFQNANSKSKLFFYCRYSSLLEKVLLTL